MVRPRTEDRISNYLLDEQIGSGSFGEVWKAHHHVFNDPVAIKIPTDPRYVRYLQREAIAIHGLRHPNVVRALDLDPYADPPYLIMEYVDGPSLRGLIDANSGGLPLEAVAAIVYGTVSALQEAHQAGVVHRDLKPANILLAGGLDPSEITPERVKVTDFGLGRLHGATAGAMMQSGSISGEANRGLAGTLAYMSPEQRDGQPIDGRADLYSVGVILHEVLTGVLPQGSDLPGSIRPGVPGWLDHFFERCYTGRGRRFSSASEMREVIERCWPPARAWARPADRRQPRTEQMEESWRCTSCNGSVNPDDQFCIHCGRQLVDYVPRCPSCHAFVGRADNFCILCGTDLREKV